MFKNIIKTGIKSSNLHKTLSFNFSSRNSLSTCFKNELEFEEKDYKPISEEEKKVFFKNSGFEFIESKDNARMELKKQSGDFQINIVYHARAPLPADEEANKQGEEMPEAGNMTDCHVLIQKGGESSGFLVDAIVMDGQININHVYVAENVQEFHTKVMTGKVDPDLYSGPEFGTLDENLQTSFVDFLNEVGVNDEAAAFIEVTSIDKDQSLYINWLKTCKNILI